MVTLFLLGSCSKDEADEKPLVKITSPSHLSTVNGFDTIQVSASISDDRNIERVTVSLRDANDINVLTTVIKRPNTSTYQLDIAYAFNNLLLERSTYHFNISAFDGKHTTTEYVAIAYSEVPRTRQGVFIVSDSPSRTSFYLLDQNYSANFYQSVQGDHLKTIVDAHHQQLVHCSAINGSLQAIDLITSNPVWNLSLNNPFYTGFYNLNQNLYLGKRSGGVQGYDKNGNPNFYTPIVNPGF
jgi:hypothetical protein